MHLDASLSSELQGAFHRLASEHGMFSGLEEGLAEFSLVVSSVPETSETVVLGVLSPAALGADNRTGISQLFHQADNMLKLYWHVLACNYVALVSSIINGLNRFEYLPALLSTRALVEHVAVAAIRIDAIERHRRNLRALRPSELRRMIGTDAIAGILQEMLFFNQSLNASYGAGRFNRDVFKDHTALLPIEVPRDDPYRQIGVMDAIDALQWPGQLIPATNPRYYYELLCDYVHPNAGANVVNVEDEGAVDCLLPGASKPTYILRRSTRRQPRSESIRLHVTQAVCIPLRESLRLAAGQMRALHAHSQDLSTFCRQLREIGLSPVVRM